MKLVLVTFFFILALAMSLVIAPTSATPEEEEEEEIPFIEAASLANQPSPLRGTSRFLAQTKTSSKTRKCNKDPRICLAAGSPGPSCCKKQCVNLMNDHMNCGVCGNKCKYTDACCKGKCVNLALDRRHCGRCNNRCGKGDYCLYGLCNYA